MRRKRVRMNPADNYRSCQQERCIVVFISGWRGWDLEWWLVGCLGRALEWPRGSETKSGWAAGGLEQRNGLGKILVPTTDSGA